MKNEELHKELIKKKIEWNPPLLFTLDMSITNHGEAAADDGSGPGLGS